MAADPVTNLPPIPEGFVLEQKPGGTRADESRAAKPQTAQTPQPRELPPIPPGFKIQDRLPPGVQLPPGTSAFRPPPPSRALDTARRAADTAMQAGEGAYNAYFGFSPDVDYKSGMPIVVQYNIDRMDNEAEKVNYLESVFGKENIAHDPKGRLVITAEGFQKAGYTRPAKQGVAVDYGPIGRRMEAEIAASAPAVAGMALLPEATGALGATGLLSRLASAGTGGLLGKGADEAVKAAQGYLRKTPAQEADVLAGEAITGTFGEGLAQVLRGTGRFVLKGYSPYIEPERKEMVANLLKRGLVPKIVQAAPVSALLPAEQSLFELVFGDKVSKANAKVLSDEVKSKLSEIGVAPDDVPKVMRAILNGDIPTSQLNAHIVDAAQKYRMRLEAGVSMSAAAARKQLDADFAAIDKELQGPSLTPEQLQGQIKTEIEARRVQLGNWASRAYGAIDDLLPGPVVPTSPLKAQAKETLDSLVKTAGTPPAQNRVLVDTPRGKMWRLEETPGAGGEPIFADPGVVKKLRDILSLGPTVTFRDAQRIRSELGRAIRDPTLTRTLGERQIGLLERAADSMFDAAEIPSGTLARKMLNETDATYKAGIAKFKDLTANRLIREAGQRGAVEPESVVASIIKSGQASKVRRIKELVTPETWKAVARADFNDILKDAADDAGTVSGLKLLRQLKARGLTLDAVYGQDMAVRLRSYATHLAAIDAAVDGRVLAEALETGTFKPMVEQIVRTKQVFDEQMKTSFLRRLAVPGAEQDRAIDWIIEGGHPDRIKQAKMFFGETSPEWQRMRETAMAKILRQAISKDGDPLTTLFNGPGLRDTLEHVGGESLTELFGKDTANDLMQFSREVEFLSNKGKRRWAGSLRAGTLVFHPLSHLGALADTFMMGHLMARPGFVKWLSLGANGNAVGWKAVAASVQTMADEMAQTSFDVTRARQ